MTSITLKLNLSEIVYDIQNKTFLTGRSSTKNENPAHIANMQANDDEENEAQILRSVTSAFMILRNRLSEYLTVSEISATNDSVAKEDDLTLLLSMPSNYNRTVTRTLAEMAHQFIVAYAIADWFSITAKGETADYSANASEALKALEEALCKRSRPLRSS